MAMIDWAKLLSQNRVRAIGIPWTEEEAHAVFILKIPADKVREGCLTLEEAEKKEQSDAEKREKTGKIPLAHLKRETLISLALLQGLGVDTESVTRDTLLLELRRVGVPASIPVDQVPKT